MLITVMGIRQNVGTTITALNLAKLLSREKQITIADLNLVTPDIDKYVQIENECCLDDVMCLCEAGMLDIEKLHLNLTKLKNNQIQILCGTQFLNEAELIKYEIVDTIIKTLKRLQGIVICDVHSEINNAGTVASLINADRVLLVTEQNPIILDETERKLNTISKINGIDLSKAILVVNKYNGNIGISIDQIKANYGTDAVYPLRAIGDVALKEVLKRNPFIVEGLIKNREKQNYIRELGYIYQVISGVKGD